MEFPSKLLEQNAFNTRPKIEEHMLVVMDKSTPEEHLNQPLQTNNKQYKIVVILLTGSKGIFNVTNSNTKIDFKKSVTDKDDLKKILIPEGAHYIKNLNIEIKRIIIDKGYYSENEYPHTIKPNFGKLGSVIEISPQGPKIRFVFNDSIRNLVGFHETILYKEYNLSRIPVDILSFDNFFIHTDNAQGRIFKGKRSGIIHNMTMEVSHGYKYIERFHGGVNWYMLDTKAFISSINFKLKNENNELVSFNGQSNTFMLSIKEVQFF